MKGRSLIFTALTTLAVGIVMIATFKSISSVGFVIVGGVSFVIAGILNLVITEGERKKMEKRRGFLASLVGRLTSAVAIIMGISMIFFHGTFSGLVNFIFGMLVLFGAIYQLLIIIYVSRPVVMPKWLYAAPLLIFVGSIVVFCSDDDPVIMMTTGISLALFGVATIIEAVIVSHSRGAFDNGKGEYVDVEYISDKQIEQRKPKGQRSLDDEINA